MTKRELHSSAIRQQLYTIIKACKVVQSKKKQPTSKNLKTKRSLLPIDQISAKEDIYPLQQCSEIQIMYKHLPPRKIV